MAGHLGYRNGKILAILNLHMAQMPPTKLRLNLIYSLGDFVGYRNGTILAILNLYVIVMPPSCFGSIPLTVWEEMSFEEFQDDRHGGHLGYQNGRFWQF